MSIYIYIHILGSTRSLGRGDRPILRTSRCLALEFLARRLEARVASRRNRVRKIYYHYYYYYHDYYYYYYYHHYHYHPYDYHYHVHDHHHHHHYFACRVAVSPEGRIATLPDRPQAPTPSAPDPYVYIIVYIKSYHMFIHYYVYKQIHMYIRIHSIHSIHSIHMYTYVHICIHMYTYVYVCICGGPTPRPPSPSSPRAPGTRPRPD